MIQDKLYKRIIDRSCICVGLDTAFDYIPENMRSDNLSESIFKFNKEIIDCTEDLVGIYKVQIAYYEAMGIEGLIAYHKTLNYLRSKDLLSIGDVKRSDISATAKQYAIAHFSGDFEADFITLNPYMGYDSITPYLDHLENNHKGIFVLLRTSNPGAKDIEYLKYNDEPLYYNIGDHLEEIGKKFIGESGYSALGMVVGGTYSLEAKEIRQRYPRTLFLIPGYGAQGGKAEDIRIYLGENMDGGIVNSSRGIIKAYQKYEDGAEKFQKYTRKAVEEMKEDIYGI